MTETSAAGPGASPRPETPPEVSVVIAAYNAEPFLAGSVGSALAQEGVTLEMIIADDASPDGTVAAAEALAAADPRVRVLRTETNGGPSAARNRAIAAARGEWVAVLDADDRFRPGRLAKMVAFGRERQADVVFDLVEEVDAEGRPLPGDHIPAFDAPAQWDLAFWARSNARVAGQMALGYLKPVIRRAALVERGIGYDERLRNSEDYLLIVRLLAAGAPVWFLPEAGYLYTRRAGSISHRTGPAEIEALLAAEREALPDPAVFGPAATSALRFRWTRLEDALACERVIAALKRRDPMAAARVLVARPRALGAVRRWLGEAFAKRAARIGLRSDRRP